jgi:tRNA threonylcarbamoyl adenosine modification protein YeaZ
MLLSIDTSAGTSVALTRTEGVPAVAETSSADTMKHAEVVGMMIADVLTQLDAEPHDVTGVVAGVGPGPFTGLRVGLAAASAFAVGRNVPLLPVVSHDAIGFDALEEVEGPVIVVTDARRRELYWSIYDGWTEHGLPRRIAGPALGKPDEVPTDFEGRALTRWDATEVSAGLLGLIASRMLAAGIPFEPFEPLYLRSPDVTMPGAPKRVNS